MKTPPFLLGLALLFWGWQSDLIIVGAVLGLALETANWSQTRWEFADEDFTRIWTFCSLLLLAAAIYAFTANQAPSELLSFLQDPNFRTQRNAGTSSARALAELIRWQPMIFFPFILAATYSVREGLPLHTISLILRRRWLKARRLRQPVPLSPVVNISYPYFAVTLFAASIHENQGTHFYWGMALLIGWALWPQRSRRYGLPVWAGALLAAILLGFTGQRAIVALQQHLGSYNPYWFLNYTRSRFDPRHARTMLGQVGHAKNSAAIVIRLTPKDGSRPPALLREASYRNFQGAVWSTGTSRHEFERISETTNINSYLLLPDKKFTVPVEIACYLSGGRGLLPLPSGTARLENLNAYILEKNTFGAVMAEGPGLVIFDAFYGPGATVDSPPDPESDIHSVPFLERAALRQVIEELNLSGKSLPEAKNALQAFFGSAFSYSTMQAPIPFPDRSQPTPLSRFLLDTRQGHCEFFATATVLLLRELGFPARYAVGYAVHETSGKNGYVVRQRDAHAWCLVYNNGIWQDFDTTPGSWVAAEAQRASPLQSISDFFSRVWFEISKVRWGQSHLRQYVLWALIPILALLLWQILRSRKKRARKLGPDPSSASLWPGLDSEFYQLEKMLAARGIVRQRGEALSHWVNRALNAANLSQLEKPLAGLLSIHYRYRFDPKGIDYAEREELRVRAAEYVKLAAQPLRKP